MIPNVHSSQLGVRLVTSAQLADQITKRGWTVTEADVIHLADNGLMPHWRVSVPGNGLPRPPMFDPHECMLWVKANLLVHHPGQPTPRVVAVVPTVPPMNDPPASLAFAAHHCRTLDVPLMASGIYFLCRGDDVVYVGQSVNVVARVMTHIAENLKRFDRWFYIPWPPQHLDVGERDFILFLRPEYNHASNGKMCVPVSGVGRTVTQESLVSLLDTHCSTLKRVARCVGNAE